MTNLYAEAKYGSDKVLVSSEQVDLELYLPLLFPYCGNDYNFILEFFIYSTTKELSTLPKEKAFNIIFGVELPPSVTGEPLVPTINYHSFRTSGLEDFLRSIKCILASKVDSFPSPEISDDTLKNDTKVKWFEDKLPALEAAALKQLKMRPWFSAIFPAETTTDPVPKPGTSNNDGKPPQTSNNDGKPPQTSNNDGKSPIQQ